MACLTKGHRGRRKAGKKRIKAGTIVAATAGVVAGALIVLGILLPLYNNAVEDRDYFEQALDDAAAKTIVKTETVTQPAKTVTVTVTPTPTPPPTPAGPATAFGPGVYTVGTDIQPGTYSAPGGSNCYWERLSSLSG